HAAIGADATHHPQVFADVVAAGPAVVAMAADQIGLHGDQLARLQVFHTRPHLVHLSPDSVAEHDRRVDERMLPGEGVHVGPAHTYIQRLAPYCARPRFGNRPILYDDRAYFAKKRSTHIHPSSSMVASLFGSKRRYVVLAIH